MSIDITAQVQPIVTEAVRNAAQSFESRLSALETQAVPVVSAEVATIAPQIGATILSTAQSVAKNAEHDVWLPRMVVGALSAAGLAILIGIEAGSHQAQDVWGALVPIVLAVAGVAGRMVVTTAAGPKVPLTDIRTTNPGA